MGVDYRDQVLSYIRARGPVLPMHIAKEMHTNILMASAMLSEMSSKGTVKISFLKVGGSPLYYAPGQEGMLLSFAQNLNEKDRRTLELVQTAKVVRDGDQDALTRVSLRNLKDFAHPLNVTHEGVTEIFWKWYGLNDTEASAYIKASLTAPLQTIPPGPEMAVPVQQVQPTPAIVQSMPVHVQQSAPVRVQRPRVAREKPRVEQTMARPIPPTPAQLPASPVQQTVLEDPALSDVFFKELQSFCAKSNIKILEHTMVKKRQDYDLVLEIPSPVGALVYYTKARNKQKLNDADLSAAFVQGQIKKLPAMLLAPGELSKKGVELLAKDLRGMTFTRLR
ncbi:hypothetical protein HY493_02390 [Candidatus Woesearchaeota archaeon]|nr:hypothetical protein [Candidatus Woesearchaeota archaeon]